jgi:integrase
MAHIRKRVLLSGKVRWQVIWKTKGRRASEMFETQRDAVAKRIAAESAKPTSAAKFRTLAADYLVYQETLVESGERERSYLDMLKGHVHGHILSDSEIADTRCCSIGTPEVQLYLNRLIGRISAKAAAKIRVTLSQIFKFGTQVGYVGTNPVRDAEIKRKKRPDAGAEAAFVLPSKAALRALVAGAASFDNTGRASAVVRVLMFGGLRMSELRGLARPFCRLVGATPSLEIVQRADRYNAIGSVKSLAGRRTVDLGPDTAQALRLWLLAAPKAPPPVGKDGLPIESTEYAFPNEDGGVWGYPNFRARFWVPLMNHCGLVTSKPAARTIRVYTKGQADFCQPLFTPHGLRHVYASLQIEQGVTPKRLQKLIGHATLKMTLDTYGHLWPDEDADRARARGVEQML